MDASPRPYPRVDGTGCVHSRTPMASCRACVEACPHGAWDLGAAELSFTPRACDGCAQCVPACPEAAIALDRRPALRPNEVFAACAPAVAAGGEGVVACLRAFGVRDLLAWAGEGRRRLVLADAGCDGCPRHTGGPSLPSLAGRVNALLAAQGRPGFVVRRLSPGAWRSVLDSAGPAEVGPDPARRRFLRGATSLFSRGREVNKGPSSAAALAGGGAGPWPWVPAIDAAACDGCDACVRICRHGALSAVDGPAYRVDPARCTGCGLCVDLCRVGAVTLTAWVEAAARDIGLVSSRCRRCGTSYRTPAAQRDRGDGTCPVCRRRAAPAALFQVLE